METFKSARAGGATAKPASKKITFSVLWAAAAIGILVVAYLFFVTIRQEQNIPEIAQSLVPANDSSKTSSKIIEQEAEEDTYEKLPLTTLEEMEKPELESTIDQVMKDENVLDIDDNGGYAEKKRIDNHEDNAGKRIAFAEDVIRTKTQNAIVTTSVATGTSFSKKMDIVSTEAYKEKPKSGRSLSEDIEVVDILFTCL
jgi:hypothetical protein